MKLGFTGTRRGMTPAQWSEVTSFLIEHRPGAVHHGDCVGADAEFVKSVEGCWWPIRVVAHPCTLADLVANTSAAERRAPLGPLVRNRNIVDEADWVIAAPAEMTEQQRGGTWSTIRYARKVGKLLAIVYPDGSVERCATAPDSTT